MVIMTVDHSGLTECRQLSNYQFWRRIVLRGVFYLLMYEYSNLVIKLKFWMD